jgi:SAM-dependent methyltransferase
VIVAEMMELATVEFLLSPVAQDALAALQVSDLAEEQTLARLQPLRRQFTAVEAGALLSLARVRQRARNKFPAAAQLFFTAEALEQATAWPIAQHRAAWVDQQAPPGPILDLGCGIGASTALLKLIFPGANVFGTQLPSDQRRVAEELSKTHGFQIADSMKSSGDAVVFMLDYLEHFECPTEHLETIIAQKPKLLVMANSFGATAVGHFPNYKIGSEKYPNKETGRAFSKWLKCKGYKKVETGFYNNRPAIWERAE